MELRVETHTSQLIEEINTRLSFNTENKKPTENSAIGGEQI